MGYATERFSKRLKELRETAGLTQEQLAKELKVSRGAISYYEKGERTPDIEFLDSVAEYFQIPLEFAMGYTNNLHQEYRNMFEFYGLTDDACKVLERSPVTGKLASIILGHPKFYALRKLYEGIIENYKEFNYCQTNYISFLITELLKDIIEDSLRYLISEQYTDNDLQEVRERIKKVDADIEQSRKLYAEHERIREEKRQNEIEQELKEIAIEYATQVEAAAKVREKFENTTSFAEFRLEEE